MSREIKFRAWDGERMHCPSNGEYLALFSGPKQVPWRIYDRHGTAVMDGQYEGALMQYTGLKDKNGREIYEDDILRNGGFICTVDYENGAFQLVAIETSDEGCWDLLFDLCRHRNTDGVEVIGNIHENPDLLK